MLREIIITCAVTGGHPNHRKHPDYPVTPAQIAAACLQARAAGAAVVHIHVRDLVTGMHTYSPALSREVVDRIRDSGSDVIVNLSCGWGGHYVPSKDDPARGGPGTTMMNPRDRLQHVIECLPDICSFDIGTFNANEVPAVAYPKHTREMAQIMLEAGVKPELEVFELGHIMTGCNLIERGLIEAPPFFQMCLGLGNASPATPEVVAMMKSLLPPGAVWSAFGIGATEFPMVATALTLGGHVRVGLEDNLYISKGEFATNGQLVERAVSIIHSLGADVADPARAAQILGLRQHRSTKTVA